MNTAEAFWALVEKTPSGCWLWKDATLNGYGRVFWKGRLTYAHRVAFEFATGAPPPKRTKAKDTAVVMHICSAPTCVRPLHLRLGTQRENMRERDERARALRAERQLEGPTRTLYKLPGLILTVM